MKDEKRNLSEWLISQSLENWRYLEGHSDMASKNLEMQFQKLNEAFDKKNNQAISK
jgi:hypothetical protein